jgi:FtsH-binding integral membrane protein
MSTTNSSHLTYSLVSALLAFAIWGGWAYAINGGSMKAALVQGSASFIITLLMVRAVTWLYRRMEGGWLQLWLPASVTILLTGSGLATLHRLADTPHILPTIAPALCVGFVFCLLTGYTLRKSEQTHEST